MKLNPKEILFGTDSGKKNPVLLAVTPPRTGERTLLGVENLLQAIAVPEPFSLELAGGADGVTLMARCIDREVVRSQLSAHYPQARIQEVPEEADPLRLDEGEQAWSITLRADGPEYVPLRTFRDDDLLDPGSDPLIALLGALTALRARRAHRGAADAALPRPRLVPAPPGKGPQAARHGAEGARLHLPDQAAPDGRRDDGRARHRRAGRPEGLPVGAGRGDMEGGAPWDGRGPGAGRRRLGMAPLEEGPQAGGRPLLIREKVSRIAFDAEIQVVAVLPPDTGHDRAEELLGPVIAAYRHFDNPAGARFKVGRFRPVMPDPEMLHPAGPGLFGRRSVLGVREVACPVAPARSRRRDAPGGALRRKGAQSLPGPGASAAARWWATPPQGRSGMPIRFPEDLLRRHHLYVARTRMGKSTLMHHLVTHKMREKAAGRDPDAIVVIDPHTDLVAGMLEHVPESAHRPGAPHRPVRPHPGAGHQPAGHPHLRRPRPHRRLGGAAWQKGLWEQWGPRMQSILEQTVKTLHEANEHPTTDADEPSTPSSTG